jgi:hypothetical protein
MMPPTVLVNQQQASPLVRVLPHNVKVLAARRTPITDALVRTEQHGADRVPVGEQCLETTRVSVCVLCCAVLCCVEVWCGVLRCVCVCARSQHVARRKLEGSRSFWQDALVGPLVDAVRMLVPYERDPSPFWVQHGVIMLIQRLSASGVALAAVAVARL